MEIQNVKDAKMVLTATRKVMADALNAPTGKTGAGVPVFNQEGRDAAEILARRLAINDELAQALLDALEGGAS